MSHIDIVDQGKRTRLLLQWKPLNPKDLNRRKDEINNGFRHLHRDDVDFCYLVYPKTDKFKKHITLRNQYEKELKIMPYSFSFINKGVTV